MQIHSFYIKHLEDAFQKIYIEKTIKKVTLY